MATRYFSSPRGRRPWLRLLLGISLAAAFFYLAVRNLDLAQAGSLLLSIDLSGLFSILILSLLVLGLRVWRWQLMFPVDSRPGGRAAFCAFVLGSFGNCVMPGRLGDLVRVQLVAAHVPVTGTGGALATVVLEKAMDGLAVLVLLAITFSFAPLPKWLVQAGLIGATAIAAVLAILILVAKQWSIRRLPDAAAGRTWLEKLLITARQLILGFAKGLEVIMNLRQFAALLLFGLIIWISECLVVYFSFRLFDIHVPIAAAVVTIVFLAVGTMLPAAPGFIGTYQFFVISALTLYGISETLGLAVSIFMNLLSIGTVLLLSVVAFPIQMLPSPRQSRV